MLWLNAASTNNDPRCVAHYFIQCIKENQGNYTFMVEKNTRITSHAGCPQVLRTDRGTENSMIAVIQPMLRNSHSDSFAREKSHIYGRSTSNQVYNNKIVIIMILTLYSLSRKSKPGGLNLENSSLNGG